MLQRRTTGLRLLADAAALVLAENDPDATVNALYDRIAVHAGVDLYASFTAEPVTRTLRLAASRGLSPAEREALRTVAYGEAVCGAVADRGLPVVVSDVQTSDETMVRWLKSAGVEAYVSYPLMAEGRLLGTLAFGSRRRPRLSPDDLEFLGTLAHYVTLAHERARLVGELRDADRRKDEFLATLAHELRNPLAPIRNGLQHHAAGGRRPARRRVRARGDGAAARADGAPGRRPARRVAASPRGKLELRRERGGAGERGCGSASRRHGPLIDAGGHALDARPAGGAAAGGRRPAAARAGVHQPAQQRRQVHRPRRPHRGAACALPTATWRCACATTASASPPRCSRAIFELFAQVDHSLERTRGRARHRPHAGQAPGRDCTAARRGAQRGAGPRQRVHRAPAARATRDASAARGPPATQCRRRPGRCASWWSTTTAMRRRRSAWSCA